MQLDGSFDLTSYDGWQVASWAELKLGKLTTMRYEMDGWASSGFLFGKKWWCRCCGGVGGGGLNRERRSMRQQLDSTTGHNTSEVVFGKFVSLV